MTTTKIKPNPEWEDMFEIIMNMPVPTVKDIHDLRKLLNGALTVANRQIPAVEGVEEVKLTYPSLDGTSIDIYHFFPSSSSTSQQEHGPQRAIVYVFGGATVAGSIDIWRPSIRDLAASTKSPVFAVEYRLAPEHPAPAAVEDVYSAVKWLQAEAGRFNIDPKRIVLYGGSAGGGISAGAALMARDRGIQYPIAAMLLYYPMLDDRTTVPSDHPIQRYYTYKPRSNDMAWKALLGREREERTDENVSIYAAPARAKDLSGLPDTFIDTGGFDLFRDEDMAFAAKLAADGNFVEFHLYPGVPHGFDGARHTRVAQEAMASRIRFLLTY